MLRSLHPRTLLLVVLLSTHIGATAANEIQWFGDLQSAHEAAVSEKRLMLLHFWGPQCGPCKRLEQTVFPDPNVVELVNRNFVAVKVNGDAAENRDLMARFQIDRYPTDVIVMPTGEVVYQFQTPLDPLRYVHELSAVQMAYGRKKGEATPAGNWPQGPQAATGLGRPAQGGPAERDFRNQVGEGVGVTSDSRLNQEVNQFDSSRSRFDGPPSSNDPNPRFQGGRENGMEGQAGLSTNRTDISAPSISQVQGQGQSQVAPNPPAAPPREIVNRYTGQTQTQNQGHTQGTGYANSSGSDVNNPYSVPAASQSGAGAGESRFAANANTLATSNSRRNTVPASPSWAGASAEQESLGAERTAPQIVPSEHPPIALDGRCPVTLANSKAWRKGDPNWGAIHRGRTYLFVSRAEQQAFLADPDRYSPVLAGMDLVHLAEGKAVEGDRRFGILFHEPGEQSDKIYLFDSEQTRNRFEQNPQQFLRPVMQAMQSGTLEGLLRR